MSALTESERRAMAELDASLPADDLVRRAGVGLADLLRTQLPDADDVTLGRVVLEIMRHLKRGDDEARRLADNVGVPANVTRAAALAVGIRQLAAASLTLTELEWKEPPR